MMMTTMMMKPNSPPTEHIMTVAVVIVKTAVIKPLNAFFSVALHVTSKAPQLVLQYGAIVNYYYKDSEYLRLVLVFCHLSQSSSSLSSSVVSSSLL